MGKLASVPAKKTDLPFDVNQALLAAFATNNRINEYLLEHLPSEIWRLRLTPGKGRTVAGIVAHMHNTRLAWLKSATPSEEVPAKLDGETVSTADAITALKESCSALTSVLAQSLAGDGRIRGFKPDVASFIAYLLAHDAHHRGQISMLARQLGHALPQSAMFGLWEWGTR